MIAVNRSTEILDHPAHRPHVIHEDHPSKKILFATDLSPSSREGLKWAASLARTMGAEILVVHVEDPLAPGDDLMYEEYRRGLATTEARMRALEVADPHMHCRQKVLLGDPAKEILWLAKHEEVDLIILGTHDRTCLSRLFNGSVAMKVLRRASCPVLVFRQGNAV